MCSRFVVPIAAHDHKTPEAKLALNADGNGSPFGINDFDFHVRLHTPDGLDTLFERISGGILYTAAGQFGHAIDTDEIAHVHIVDHPPRYISWNERATGEASVQAPQIKLPERGVV